MAQNMTTVSRGFISYTRDDNRDFDGVVDRLRSDIAGRFHARNGRNLQLFLDRESIGWGENWRAKIRESVQSATVFIPVVTMRFFESDACREELLTFYSNAKQFGVTELILPVILTGSDQILADDDREEVRLIESLNYKDIETAWLAGYDSSDWRRLMFEMVRDLSSALTQAENALSVQEQTPLPLALTTAASSHSEFEGDSSEADATALFEQFAALTDIATRMTEAITELGAATDVVDMNDVASLSPAQQKAKLVVLANALKKPAAKFGDVAEELERVTADTDAQLRAVVEELRAIDSDEAREQLTALLESLNQFESMATVLGQMSQLASALQLASVVNVSVRKAVRPAIRGMQSTRTAIATALSWKDLV